MSILKYMLQEYGYNDQLADDQDDYVDDQDQVVDNGDDDQDLGEPPPAKQVENKVHKIKQTFAVDQGDIKLDTTVMIRVVARNEDDARRVADQQLAKLAAYMKDIDLNTSNDQSVDNVDVPVDDRSAIRERAAKLWRR